MLILNINTTYGSYVEVPLDDICTNRHIDDKDEMKLLYCMVFYNVILLLMCPWEVQDMYQTINS